MRANLSDTNASGADFAGASFADADLAGTRLAGARLDNIQSGGVTGSPASLPSNWVLRSGWLIEPNVTLDNDNLSDVNLSSTDMAGAYVSFSTFAGADLSGADLAGAFFVPADFAKADLRGADLFGANLNGETWTGATCPDGSSANSHGGSCVGALAFRFAGFITPKPGSTVAASAKRVVVHFKLTTVSGAVIPGSVSAAIGAAKRVRVTLAGRGITATSAYCSWDATIGEFACTITDPRGIAKGKSHSYTITVAEEPGTAFQTAPRLGAAANPATIHFLGRPQNPPPSADPALNLRELPRDAAEGGMTAMDPRPADEAGEAAQAVTAGRDAYVAGRDQYVFNVNVPPGKPDDSDAPGLGRACSARSFPGAPAALGRFRGRRYSGGDREGHHCSPLVPARPCPAAGGVGQPRAEVQHHPADVGTRMAASTDAAVAVSRGAHVGCCTSATAGTATSTSRLATVNS